MFFTILPSFITKETRSVGHVGGGIVGQGDNVGELAFLERSDFLRAKPVTGFAAYSHFPPSLAEPTPNWGRAPGPAGRRSSRARGD